jgi:hypothetical protein
MSTQITRSPRHPQVGLPEAIERVRQIYEKEHIHAADKAIIASDMGYSGLNGASLGMIATLKQYGLLEMAGDNMKVSEDALTILETPEGDSNKTEVLWRAALAPKLFTDLYETYGDRLPSDENLYLNLTKRGFNKKAAGVAVRAYRETIRFVEEAQSAYNAKIRKLGELSSKGAAVPQQPPTATKPSADPFGFGNFFGGPQPQTAAQPAAAEERTQVFQISKDATAQVVFRGQITQEAVDKLCEILRVTKDIYPTKAELAPPVQSAPPKPPAEEVHTAPEQPKRLDETIPGGRYVNDQGVLVDANNNPINE